MSYEGLRLADAFPVVNPPRAASWTVYQIGSNGVLTDIPGGGLSLFATNRVATEDSIVAGVAVPSTPYIVTAGFIPNLQNAINYSACGLCVYGGSGTSEFLRAVCLYGDANETFRVIIRQQNAVVSPPQPALTQPASSASDFNVPSRAVSRPMQWMRLSDNGTTRLWQLSTDGRTFHTFVSEATNTGGTPHTIGITVDPYNTRAGMVLAHWSVT